MMNRCFACLLVGAGLASAVSAAAYDIGPALADEAFWKKTNPVMFVKKHQEHGFKFTDESRGGADSRLDGGVTYAGIEVYESRVTFAGSLGVARVELVFYAAAGTEMLETVDLGGGKKMVHHRRTEKKLAREDFVAMMKTVRAQLTPKGAKVPPQESENVHQKNVVQKSQTWEIEAIPARATLVWNYEQQGRRTDTFRPGFVRLAIEGPSVLAAERSSGGVKAAKSAKGAATIVSNVVNDPRGDVFIDNVPMVDQGQKGYCAVAASERVLRYYGVQVDEHEIAQAAGTSAEQGTSTRGMKDSVTAVGRRYKLGTVVTYGDFEKPVGERINGIVKEVDNYNKAAKKLKKPEIGEDVYVKRQGNMIVYSPAAVDAAMDSEVLLEMKVNGAQKARYKKFLKDVRDQVNKGIPLFWGVTLGIYPEADLPQAQGGHMRLIIGYNDKKNEILYTDTWGKGHELKRMPADWAWTISHCLMYMKPLR